MDERFVGRWRAFACATWDGGLWASDPAFTLHEHTPPAITFVIRADGTGVVLRGRAPQAQAVTWRVEGDDGRLFLTMSADGGEASQRVWLVGGDRLVMAAGPHSRQVSGGREWLLSDGWVRGPHELLRGFCAGFAHAREPEAVDGSGPDAEPGAAADPAP